MARSPGFARRLGVLVLAVLLVLSTGAAGLAAGLLERTPRQMFLEAKYRQITAAAARHQEASVVTRALSSRILEEPSVTSFSLEGSLSGALLPAELAGLGQFIGDARLVGSHQIDPVKNRESTTVTFDLKGEPFVTVGLLRSAEEMAIRFPQVDDRYLAVLEGGFPELIRALGGEWTGPDPFANRREIQEIMQVDSDDLRAIGADYALYLAGSIRDEEVTLTDNAPYDSPAGPQELTQLTLSLSEERVEEVLTGLLQKAEQDDRLLNLLSAKAVEYMTFLEVSGAASAELGEMALWRDQGYAKEQIKLGLQALKKAIPDLALPGGIQTALLVDGANQVVQERITAALGEAEGAVGIEWVTDYGRGADRIVHSLRLTERQFGQTVAHLTIDRLTEKEAVPGKDRVTTDLVLELADPGVPPIQGKVVQTNSSSVDGDQFEQTVDVKVTAGPKGLPLVVLTLRGEGVVDFAGLPATPELTAANSVNLSALSEAEQAALQEQLAAQFQAFVDEGTARLAPYFPELTTD